MTMMKVSMTSMVVTATTTLVVAILALQSPSATDAAFLLPAGGSRSSFVGDSGSLGNSILPRSSSRSTSRRMATVKPSSSSSSLSPMTMMVRFPRIKKLFRWGKAKKEELDAKIAKRTEELVKKAEDGLEKFEDYLVESMKNKGEEVTQEVAVEVVKLLNGNWDVAIAANKNETKKMMEGAIDEMTDDLVSLGLAADSEQDDTKAALKSSRLKWDTTFDASTYPLRVQNDVYVGNSKAIEFFGQFQFDVLEKRAVFALDELVVFGVEVDLASVIQEAKEAEEEAEEGAEEEAEEETEEEAEEETEAETKE